MVALSTSAESGGWEGGRRLGRIDMGVVRFECRLRRLMKT